MFALLIFALNRTVPANRKDEGKAVKKSAGIKRGKKKKKGKAKQKESAAPAEGDSWVVGGGDEGGGILPDIVQFAEIAQEFPNIRLKVVLEGQSEQTNPLSNQESARGR